VGNRVKPSKNLKEMIILYVEDDFDTREVLSQRLSLYSKKVITAENGEEGFKKFLEFNPDIILTDIQMPVKDGLSMLKDLEDHLSEKNRTIVATAFNDSDYLLRAIELNVNYYLIKPIDREKLIHILNDASQIIINSREKENRLAYLQNILNLQDSSLIVLDEKFSLQYANNRFYTEFRIERNDQNLICKIIDEVNNLTEFKNRVDGEHISEIIELRNKNYMAKIYSFCYVDETEYIINLTDVTSLKNEIENLKYRVSIDPLTQVENRTNLNKYCEQKIILIDMHSVQCSLIMFDIDHFKNVNDTYGHDVGDEVLQKLSSFVKAEIRDTDIFIRLGGEEFLLILPKVDTKGAVFVAEKLRISIEKDLKFSGIEKITCSFGVTSLRAGDRKENVLKRVDEALYISKNSGRNCVNVK
jgi:diguanylate cyclase (GGDEF)-like protein